MMKEFLYHMENPGRGLRTLIVFDEAHAQILSKDLETRYRTPFMSKLMMQARAFGLGIVALAQEPVRKLLTDVIANTNIKLCLNLADNVEISGMSAHMGHSAEQIKAFQVFKERKAICKKNRDFLEPVMLDIFDYEDDDHITDEEVTWMMSPYWDELLGSIQPESGPKWRAPSKVIALPSACAPLALEEKTGKTTIQILTNAELTFLRTVHDFPWRLVTEIYALLKDPSVKGQATISPGRANKIQQKLIDTGFLESVPVLGTRGRPKCLFLTEKGLD